MGITGNRCWIDGVVQAGKRNAPGFDDIVILPQMSPLVRISKHNCRSSEHSMNNVLLLEYKHALVQTYVS